MINNTKPTILDTKTAAKTKIFCVESLKLRFNNGNVREFECLKSIRNRAVMIIPILDDKLLLIREYAAGLNEYELGLPKGLMESDENVFESANRELKEEVGYGSNEFHQLRTLSISPQYMDHKIHVVIAKDLYPEKLPGDEPEPIEVVPYPLAKLDSLLMEESLNEARTLSALFLFKQWLLQNDNHT